MQIEKTDICNYYFGRAEKVNNVFAPSICVGILCREKISKKKKEEQEQHKRRRRHCTYFLSVSYKSTFRILFMRSVRSDG